ncbi:type-1B angiotensin II receptor-like [Strongylocentrotus purpuratus]|uniref:G-protein coupled receptors family 1 profile domain-containing protein n=1 Tax=Strongylocentrotus purpuratus TaxID=7668 RepID=A0A7M7G0P8_STRPU|nr:type-1B angiotensin II receptor-like [Strongylocentrotus purpuratus]
MVLVLGLPGNAIIIQAYAWKKRKASTDILIMAQAIVDFIACLFTPVFIIRSGFPKLITTGLCRMSPLAEEAPAFMSLFLTTVISIDRYMAVCHPLRRRMTVRMTIVLVTLCVVVSIAFNIPLVVLSQVRFSDTVKRRLCDISLRKESYHVVVAATCSIYALFILSIMTTTVLYAFIYNFLRKRAKIHAGLVDNELPVATISSKNQNTCTPDHAFMPGAESKDFGGVTTTKTAVQQLHVAPDRCSNNKHLTSSPDSKVTDSHFMSPTIEPSQNNLIPLPLRQALHHQPTSSLKRSLSRRRGTNQPNVLKKKQEADYGRKTTRMLLIISIFFFLTWTPSMIIPIIPRSIISNGRDIPGFYTIINILIALKLTNHIVNFFV